MHLEIKEQHRENITGQEKYMQNTRYGAWKMQIKKLSRSNKKNKKNTPALKNISILCNIYLDLNRNMLKKSPEFILEN